MLCSIEFNFFNKVDDPCTGKKEKILLTLIIIFLWNLINYYYMPCLFVKITEKL